MKFLRVFLSALLLAVAVCSARAGDEDKVTAQVHDFYQWYVHYLETKTDENPLKKARKEMSRYVAASRLTKLARVSADSQEGDYFLGSPDCDPGWEKNITVSNVKIDQKGHATAEVLLVGEQAGKMHAKLVLVLEGGLYKIDMMEPIPDLAAMAAAQVRMFYEQYLHYLANAISSEAPLNQDGTRDGITADCAKKAAGTGADAGQKIDYILQSKDWDPAWEQHVVLKKAEVGQDNVHGTTEVMLTGGTMVDTHLKVSFKREKDTFKIDGVEKVND